MLLVISEDDLRAIERAVVNAARNATELSGKLASIGTISPQQLRTAARVAAEVATGETVWPGSDELVIPRPRHVHGHVRMED